MVWPMPATCWLMVVEERLKIPVVAGGQRAREGRELRDGFLGRLRAAGQPADAVRHGVELQFVVAEKAVLVFLADLADVGEGGGADAHG